MTELQDRLRRLSLNDQSYLEGQVSVVAGGAGATHLDSRSYWLASVAALIALDGSVSTFGWATSAALAAGVTSDELVDLLVALSPIIGTARIVAAAPKLGLALGYDVEADIEGLDAGLGD